MEPDDQRAVDAWCEVASSRPLVVPEPDSAGLSTDPFPMLDDQLGVLEAWQAGLPKGERRLAERLVALAHRLADSTSARSLLHGDLHDENILLGGDGTFCAIAPKGVWGDPAYEPACFLMNRWTRTPAPSPPMAVALAKRLELNARRVLGWTLVHTALSLAWSEEDDGVAASASDPRRAILRQARDIFSGRAIGLKEAAAGSVDDPGDLAGCV